MCGGKEYRAPISYTYSIDCPHPRGAYNVTEFKESSDRTNLQPNESWLCGQATCRLCDAGIHVKNKCTGVFKDSKPAQEWSGWELDSLVV